MHNARRYRKITQSELVEGIGVSRGIITYIEHSKVESPQPIVTTALCSVLKIDPDWLIYGNDLQEDIVLSWCTKRDSESLSGARRRIQSVRELLKYLSAIGIGCYVIPSTFPTQAPDSSGITETDFFLWVTPERRSGIAEL